MPRYCYCSKILPGKNEIVRAHWAARKAAHKDEVYREAEKKIWDDIQMVGFESWLQQTRQGDYMINCLEGNSLKGLFQGLTSQIAAGNFIAVGLHAFYIEVLGVDYLNANLEPQLDSTLDVSFPSSDEPGTKRSFICPLLPHKEEEHRNFMANAMSNKRVDLEAAMKTFGISRLTSWIQITEERKYVVTYAEYEKRLENRSKIKPKGENSPEWQSISLELMSHTGLSAEELIPNIEWLTK
jgi:hypothetical protein